VILGTCAIPKPRARGFASGLHYPLALALSLTRSFPRGGNLQALRTNHPAKPSGFTVLRLHGSGNLWVTEYIIRYTAGPVHVVSIMEFEGEKVAHETQYFAEPFEAPAWRTQWVELKTR